MKRNKNRDEAFANAVKIIVRLHTLTDMRLGQIVANAVREFDGRVNCDPFYLYDEDLEEGLEALEEKYGK